MPTSKKLTPGLIAEESEKTKKARAKLEERLRTQEKHVTKAALFTKSQEIKNWIDRHASEREVVDKDISLFDQNRNSAKESRNIAKLQQELADK
jgi:hypothetical protein